MVLQVQMATELSGVSAQLARLQLELLHSIPGCYMVLQMQMATELSSASAQLAILQLELLHSVTWCYRCRWPQN